MGRGTSGAGARAKGARASKGAGGGGAAGGSPGGGPPDASKATVKFSPDTSPAEIRAAKAAMAKLFGDRFTLQDFASAAGAPDNAVVVLDYVAPYHGLPAKFVAHIHSPDLEEMQRTFSVNRRGQKVVHNDVFSARQTGGGLGLTLFTRQVENATALGFRAITTNAARGAWYVGYDVWPKFGYNAKLDAGIRGALPAELKGARSMHELRKTQTGRDWWQSMGDSIDMRFNLNPGSRSYKILRKYAAEKASQPPGRKPPPSNPAAWEDGLITL
jgi:hypothetical protein